MRVVSTLFVALVVVGRPLLVQKSWDVRPSVVEYSPVLQETHSVAEVCVE